MEDNLVITPPEQELEDRLFKRMSGRSKLIGGGIGLAFTILVGLIITAHYFLMGEISSMNTVLDTQMYSMNTVLNTQIDAVNADVIKNTVYLEILVNSLTPINATGLP